MYPQTIRNTLYTQITCFSSFAFYLYVQNEEKNDYCVDKKNTVLVYNHI